MIHNRYPGRCPCSKYVQAGEGYVRYRRIVCADCAAIAAEGAEDLLSPIDVEFEGREIYGFDDV